METRMEKNKRVKKEKRIFKLKCLIILLLGFFTVYGVNIVNNTIIDLNCLENSNLLYYDYINRYIHILGRTYLLDFEILKNLF